MGQDCELLQVLYRQFFIYLKWLRYKAHVISQTRLNRSICMFIVQF